MGVGHIGYVVIEWRAKTGEPHVCATVGLLPEHDAKAEAKRYQKMAAQYGKKEKYTIAEVRSWN